MRAAGGPAAPATHSDAAHDDEPADGDHAGTVEHSAHRSQVDRFCASGLRLVVHPRSLGPRLVHGRARGARAAGLARVPRLEAATLIVFNASTHERGHRRAARRALPLSCPRATPAADSPFTSSVRCASVSAAKGTVRALAALSTCVSLMCLRSARIMPEPRARRDSGWSVVVAASLPAGDWPSPEILEVPRVRASEQSPAAPAEVEVEA